VKEQRSRLARRAADGAVGTTGAGRPHSGPRSGTRSRRPWPAWSEGRRRSSPAIVLVPSLQSRASARRRPRESAAKAYLFGSYARVDATTRSDLDIMVIVKKMPEDLLGETADLTSAIHEALRRMGDNAYKEIDLILTDEATFNDYKDARSTVYYDVHREGVRLVLGSSAC